MNKFMLLSTVFLLSACANRGYDHLPLEVPELYPGFKVENYYKKETPKNTVYVEKNLPEIEKEKEEFYKAEYVEKQKPESYIYYIPKDRLPEHSLLKKIERIGTTHNREQKAVLVR